MTELNELNRCGFALWKVLGDLEKLKDSLLGSHEKEQYAALCQNASSFLATLKENVK